MKWKEILLDELLAQLKTKVEWSHLGNGISENGGIGVHLAIFSEPFLTALFCGSKTIECRFSIKRISPFRRVYPKDLVLIKKVSGPIVGFFIAEHITYWVKGGKFSLNEIRAVFDKGICADLVPEFWSGKEKYNYGTFIRIADLNVLKEINVPKSDRVSWHVLKQAKKPIIFNDYDGYDNK